MLMIHLLISPLIPARRAVALETHREVFGDPETSLEFGVGDGGFADVHNLGDAGDLAAVTFHWGLHDNHFLKIFFGGASSKRKRFP